MAGAEQKLIDRPLKVKSLPESIDYQHALRDRGLATERPSGQHQHARTTKPTRGDVWLDFKTVLPHNRFDVFRAVFFGYLLRAAAPKNMTKVRAVEGGHRYISREIPDFAHFMDFDKEVDRFTLEQRKQFAYLSFCLKINGENDANLNNMARSGDNLALYDCDRQGYYWSLSDKELDCPIFVEQNDQGVKVDLAPEHASFTTQRHRPRQWFGLRCPDLQLRTYQMIQGVSSIYSEETYTDPVLRHEHFKAGVTMLIQGSENWIDAIRRHALEEDERQSQRFMDRLVHEHKAQLAHVAARLTSRPAFQRDFLTQFASYREHVIQTCNAYNMDFVKTDRKAYYRESADLINPVDFKEKYVGSGLIFSLDEIDARLQAMKVKCLYPEVSAETHPEALMHALAHTAYYFFDAPIGDDAGDYDNYALQILNYLREQVAHFRSLENMRTSAVAYQAAYQTYQDLPPAAKCEEIDTLFGQWRMQLMSRSQNDLTRLARSATPNNIEPSLKTLSECEFVQSHVDPEASLVPQLKSIGIQVAGHIDHELTSPLVSLLGSSMNLPEIKARLENILRLGPVFRPSALLRLDQFFANIIPMIIQENPQNAAAMVADAQSALNIYYSLRPQDGFAAACLEEVQYRLTVLSTVLPTKGRYSGWFGGHKAKLAKALGKFPKRASQMIDAVCQPVVDGGYVAMSSESVFQHIRPIMKEGSIKSGCFRKAVTVAAYQNVAALTRNASLFQPYTVRDAASTALTHLSTLSVGD